MNGAAGCRFVEKMDEFDLQPSAEQRVELQKFFYEGARLSNLLLRVAGDLSGLLASAALVLLYLLFLLLGRPAQAQREKRRVMYAIEKQLQLYVVVKARPPPLCLLPACLSRWTGAEPIGLRSCIDRF